MMNEMKDEIDENMNANRKTDREDLREMWEEMMNANLKETKDSIRSGQVEMRSIVNAWTEDMKNDRRETMFWRVRTYIQKTWNSKLSIGRSLRKRPQ
jgi:hypothetical protein